MSGEERGKGPAGLCICPECGLKQLHEAGKPCRKEKCPKCGTEMVREGSYHHITMKKKGGE